MVVFGKYISGESLLHKLDSRLKLISVILLFFTAGFISSGSEFLLFILLLILLFFMCGSVVKFVVRGVWSFKWLILLTLLLPAFFIKGKTFIYIEQFDIFISEEGVISGLQNSGKLLLFISFSSILMSTTTILGVTDGISYIIRPLKWVKFPVDNFSLMIGVSIKFIPIIFGEGQRIRNAQILRGGESSKNIVKRAVNTVSIIIPLLISVFKRGEEMAFSLEARGYGIQKERTSYLKMKLKKTDWASLFILISFIIVVIYV